MATLQALQVMSDVLLLLKFAYTAVELVEAQLERSLCAAQAKLEDAITEEEALEMEKVGGGTAEDGRYAGTASIRYEASY
ncbi:hypothetical protein FPV67DRAFT_1672277 [Lyophyllum atratum]|nr:hypothetical protein FPV67DRAFT_1672277 [Lyophyllum atratum]